MISISGLSKAFGQVHVIRDLSLEIETNAFCCLVGQSGAGKSTLLHIIGTLESFDKGKVLVHHQDLATLNQKGLSRFRNQHLGFVFQFHHLLPEFSALENVCIPGWIAKTEDSKVLSKAKELLDYMGLSHRFDHKPGQLSGGEQQRVAVARALINSPALLLADEPTGNLDHENSIEIIHLFSRLQKELSLTILVATHDKELSGHADRVITMQDGRIL